MNESFKEWIIQNKMKSPNNSVDDFINDTARIIEHHNELLWNGKIPTDDWSYFRWKRFVKDSTNNNEEMIGYFERAWGMFVRDNYKHYAERHNLFSDSVVIKIGRPKEVDCYPIMQANINDEHAPYCITYNGCGDYFATYQEAVESWNRKNIHTIWEAE